MPVAKIEDEAEDDPEVHESLDDVQELEGCSDENMMEPVPKRTRIDTYRRR
ncbi:unnamed protein product [Ceutorhynchus assimilis]|uniref:Uncharacterized protein n=1 Tax=Ceutorhynchus assimilis TaxID=467358 RepID=A0A9P0DGQ9_9CUCU|nr:unnamed protein product [Ceutorhynchus assimilis]